MADNDGKYRVMEMKDGKKTLGMVKLFGDASRVSAKTVEVARGGRKRGRRVIVFRRREPVFSSGTCVWLVWCA